MHNLFRLSSLASMEGQYYKPRMDRELLERYHEGILATTGCPSGEVQTLLRLGKYDEALAAAAYYRDLFGAGSYFVELMDHGLEIERRVRTDLLRIAKDLDLPLLATNDLHYTHQQDAVGHDALLCVQSGSTMNDADRFSLEGDGYYLKTAEEMRHVFRELPEACDNTLLVAERCEVTFTEGRDLMPRFPVPEGDTEETLFLRQVEDGLQRRYPDGISTEVRERADLETSMILQMGFPGYFLVTADLINWAKSQGIRVGPGRGSATGAIVAYAMGITELDPLEHGLIFERFLNPERVSMPDIDIDFDERGRGEVLRYVTEKYGEDRVSQVVTYGTIKAKQALKDASRVLGYPYAMGERITKAMPPAGHGQGHPAGRQSSTAAHKRYGEATELRGLYDERPRRHGRSSTPRASSRTSSGSGGCTPAPSSCRASRCSTCIPLLRREQDGAIITQFDYPTCETLGLLKMDFLGPAQPDGDRRVRAQHRGATAARPWSSRTSPSTTGRRSSCSRAATRSVSSSSTARPMRALLRAMRPDSFEDISAVIALYRPGPMAANAHIDYADRKNGRKPVMPIHPELAEPLAEILDETYGLVVYQEQVQAIARKVAGYSLGQADLLRRAMGKKKKAELDAQLTNFTAGMQANGFSVRPPSTRCGTRCCRSVTTASTSRTRPATGWCRTGRRTSRPTTRPSTWRRC